MTRVALRLKNASHEYQLSHHAWDSIQRSCIECHEGELSKKLPNCPKMTHPFYFIQYFRVQCVVFKKKFCKTSDSFQCCVLPSPDSCQVQRHQFQPSSSREKKQEHEHWSVDDFDPTQPGARLTRQDPPACRLQESPHVLCGKVVHVLLTIPGHETVERSVLKTLDYHYELSIKYTFLASISERLKIVTNYLVCIIQVGAMFWHSVLAVSFLKLLMLPYYTSTDFEVHR